MAKQAATNKGTCQWCNRIQKLPGGRLSTHGYTVEHGFFHGECRGTGHLPYEQSCDLIQTSIDSATAYKAGLEAQITELAKPAAEPKGWWNEYVGRTKYNPDGYRWALIELYIKPEDAGSNFPTLWFTNHKGKEERMCLSGVHGRPLLEAATELNRHRIWFLKKSIEELDTYIARQTERVTKWELKPLLPLK